jgi:hypothetical protein
MGVHSERISESQGILFETRGVGIGQIIGDHIQPVLLGQCPEKTAVHAGLHGLNLLASVFDQRHANCSPKISTSKKTRDKCPGLACPDQAKRVKFF